MHVNADEDGACVHSSSTSVYIALSNVFVFATTIASILEGSS